MSKRLQVVIDDAELRSLQRVARSKGMTLAEWVRQALRKAVSTEPVGSVEKKLAVIRSASRHAFPAPDIETMLNEIEQGYLAERTE